MMHYSVQPSDRIFVKDYGFLSFAKTIGKNIGKNTSKILLSGQYSQKLVNHAKQSAIDAIKAASKKATQKISKATDDLISKKNADRITKVSNTSPQNSSET